LSIDVAELLKVVSETISQKLEDLNSENLRRKHAQEIALELLTKKFKNIREPLRLLEELETELWLRYDILLSRNDRERFYHIINGK